MLDSPRRRAAIAAFTAVAFSLASTAQAVAGTVAPPQPGLPAPTSLVLVQADLQPKPSVPAQPPVQAPIDVPIHIPGYAKVSIFGVVFTLIEVVLIIAAVLVVGAVVAILLVLYGVVGGGLKQ